MQSRPPYRPLLRRHQPAKWNSLERRWASRVVANSRVKAHYLRGRDAGHFGRWLGARSDVIYTIMSDEQQRQRPKGPRPFGLQRKSPPGFVEGLDRILVSAATLPYRSAISLACIAP
jgi:hypothetical protein